MTFGSLQASFVLWNKSDGARLVDIAIIISRCAGETHYSACGRFGQVC